MECKNCQRPLTSDTNFCLQCGAKVIRNRLTFKILWMDFQERFLNYDNTFLRTLIHLFSRPQEVILGYIEGVRKKYMDPISYFGIALTLSGFQVFLTKRLFQNSIDMDIFHSGMNQEVFRKTFTTALDYQALIFVLIIPLFAFCGWLVMNRRRHLFTEHIVTSTYILAQYTIVTTPVNICLLFLWPEIYASFGFSGFLLMIAYALYAYQRIGEYRIGWFLFRACLFLMSFGALYLLFSILIMITLIITGVVSPEELKGPHG